MLEVIDESSNYYADFYNLKVVIKGMVRVKPEYLNNIVPSNHYEREAIKVLGGEVEYYRELTKIGIRKIDVEENVRKLLQHFEENSLPYLKHPSFPERMVMKRWRELAQDIKKQEIEKR
jgi:hypothetical protein